MPPDIRGLLGPLVLALLLSAGCRDATDHAAPSPAAASGPTRTAPSHGFNDAIAWRTFDEALAASAATGRPVMVVVHASWCSKCKALRPAFFNPEVVALSEKFLMVNVDQDRLPQIRAYAPDGDYIPRVLFFDPTTGEVDPTLVNPTRRRFRYFYGPQDDLASVMKRALGRHGSGA